MALSQCEAGDVERLNKKRTLEDEVDCFAVYRLASFRAIVCLVILKSLPGLERRYGLLGKPSAYPANR